MFTTNFIQKDSKLKYVLIVNKSLNKLEVVRLNIDPKISGIREVSSVSGKLEKVQFARIDHTLELSLLPGEGKLFRLDNQ